MILRIAKVVVAPREAAALPEVYAKYTNSFTRRAPGNVAVRLLRSADMPSKYFVHSWWTSREDLIAAESTPEYASMIAELRPLLLERMSVWENVIVDGGPQTLQSASPRDVVSRLVKVTVRPGKQDELVREFRAVTSAFTRRQPGCLRVRLYRDRAASHIFFIQSYWARAEQLAAALAAERLVTIRRDALRYLEERIQVWMLHLMDDDTRQPIFNPTGA